MRTGTLMATLVAALLVIVAVAPAVAQEVVIPLGQVQQVSDNLNARLIQINIGGESRAQTYTEHPEAMAFPLLVYRYENVGSQAENGHLHVNFTDDLGNEYETRDAGTLMSIAPGKNSADRYLEVAIPKERKIVKLTVIKGFEEVDYPLTYPGATVTPTPTTQPISSPTTEPSASPQKLCLGALALPLLAVGAVCIGYKARK